MKKKTIRDALHYCIKTKMWKIMRLNAVFLLLSLTQAWAVTSYSQQTKLTLKMNNSKVIEVLDEIENNSEFYFLFNQKMVDVERRVDIDARDKTVEKILGEIFDGTNVNYLIKDRQIVLTTFNEKKPAGQQKAVTGTVTGEDGLGIPGVSVLEKGTTNGTVTNIDGKYSIVVQDGAVLQFSFVGMKTVDKPTQGQSVIDVLMETSTEGIDEVVVTALGIKKEAKALGYAVSKVSTERILASGPPVNALQSLYGSAAGVQVASTAVGPTGGMQINVRNAVAFDENSNTRPLIVVDGVPIHDETTSISGNARTGRDNGTGINDINPDDIASFEILKGAKASVLYGSEGANGVILITTKSGAKSKGLGISASFTTTWDNAAFLPDLQRQYGTGRSPSTTVTDDEGFYINDDGARALDYSGAAFGPKFDPNVDLVWWDGSTRPWKANDRTIYEQLFQQGRQYTSNVSLTSGGEKGSMRFSYTNMHMKSYIPGAKYDKNTFSMSANYKMNDYISIKYSANYYVTKNYNASYTQSFDSQGATSSLGSYAADIDVDLLKSYMVTDAGYNYFQDEDRLNQFISNGRRSIVNSLWDWTQDKYEFSRFHNIQSLTLDAKINKTFGATVMGGIDITSDRSEYKAMLQDANYYGTEDGNVYTDYSRAIRKTYGQAMLNFDTDVEDINISGFVGGVIRHNYLEKKGASAIGTLVIPNYFSFSNLGTDVYPDYLFENQESILYSVLGSVQFEWKDQFYVEVQARNDWSSILPPENNSYFYPGASATWIASNTLALPDVVNFFKIRTSWADVGRPGPIYFSNVNLSTSAVGNSYTLTPPSSLPPMDENYNPNLKPERKRELEFGLEGYLFDNQRLGVDFSFYHNNIYDQIMAVDAPSGLGVNYIRMNAGEVRTNGWELALKTKPLYTRDFKWDLNFTFAGSKTKVIELDGSLTQMTLYSLCSNAVNIVAEVGGEYGAIYQAKGLQRYNNPSDENDAANGEYVVETDGTAYAYSSTVNKRVGKLLPDVTGGVFTSFEYKDFRLLMNFDYSFGATFISEQETYMMASGMLKESLKYRDEEHGGVAYYLDGSGAKVKGTNPDGGATFHDGVILDGVQEDGTTNNEVVSAEEYYYGTYFSNGFFPEDRIYKKDYIALRNIALDYKVPAKISRKFGVNGLVLSVFANNVCYLYKDAPNTIPESSNGTGFDSSSFGTTALPAARSIGASIKLNL